MDASTLGSTNDKDKYKGFSVGGPVAAITGASAATGMQITGIAVFEGVLAEGPIKAYVWPSEDVEPEPEPAGEYESLRAYQEESEDVSISLPETTV